MLYRLLINIIHLQEPENEKSKGSLEPDQFCWAEKAFLTVLKVNP